MVTPTAERPYAFLMRTNQKQRKEDPIMPKLDPRDPKIRVRPQPPRTPQPKVKPQPPNTSQSRVGSNTGRPLKPTPTPTPRELYMAKLKRQKELKDRTQQSLKSFFQRPSVGKTAIVAITGLIAAT